MKVYTLLNFDCQCSQFYTQFILIQDTPSQLPGVTAVLKENSCQVENNEEEVALEIAATARSLKTNLFMSFAFIVIFISLANFSETQSVLVVSTMKSMVPILTTIANFGKIQHVLTLYWQNIYFHLIKCFKCAVASHVTT
jgi:hypothetical protein